MKRPCKIFDTEEIAWAFPVRPDHPGGHPEVNPGKVLTKKQ